MDEDDRGDLWFGTCKGCGEEWTIPDFVLREHYPEHTAAFDVGEFLALCSVCDTDVDLRRQHIKVIPISAWTLLRPADDCCPECAHEHPAELPHNLTLFYKYYFRHREGVAGREERWPTWTDAMAHCDQAIREGWIRALAHHGVVV